MLTGVRCLGPPIGDRKRQAAKAVGRLRCDIQHTGNLLVEAKLVASEQTVARAPVCRRSSPTGSGAANLLSPGGCAASAARGLAPHAPKPDGRSNDDAQGQPSSAPTCSKTPDADGHIPPSDS